MSWKSIEARAAKRMGGAPALEAELPRAKSRAALLRIPDSRWLAEMTRSVFQAGFVWRVIESKWPGFEAAFDGFDPAKVARYSENKLAQLKADERIVRNPQKIRATRDNALFVCELAKKHGSVARFVADWPETDIVGLWRELKERGARLGGFTGQFVLRHLGKDTPMLTDSVLKALRVEGVLEGKNASSQAAQRRIQEAFNGWREESGRSLCELSKILALSVD
ncbi:MAG TPA: DNA-3-methyladenine glycosylase I [Myxococcota bacterium]|nr:DNA-3-methyladenine glycosylase I [Myxococcota bacterium]